MNYDLVCIDTVDKYIHGKKQTVVLLWGRNEKGERQRFEDSSWKPYFFVDANTTLYPSSLQLTQEYCDDLYGKKVRKVTTDLSGDVGVLRRHFEKHWQADIRPEKAYMIERNIYASFATVGDKIVPAEPLYLQNHTCFFDMEVDAEATRFPLASEAKEAIVSFAGYDLVNNRWTLFVWREDQQERIVQHDPITSIRVFCEEKKMIEQIVQYLRGDFDEYVGWNSNTWDWEYLINRCEMYGIDYKCISPIRVFFKRVNPLTGTEHVCKGRIFLDGLVAYKKMTGFEAKLESYSLEYVVWHELGEKRVKQVLHDLWRRDVLETALYPKKDTDWVVRIFAKRKIMEYFMMMRRISGCSLEDSIYNSKVIDLYMLHKAHEKGIVLPSKPPYEGREKKGSKYQGAMVVKPVVGLHYNVGVLDFKSHYPYIIVACNLSPETIDPNGELDIGNGVRIRMDKVGFLPSIIQELIDRRNALRGEMDTKVVDSPEWKLLWQYHFALKFFITSFYGVFGYKQFRLYRIEIAATITYMGRELILTAIDVIENEMGHKVIYGDTDSLFDKLPNAEWSTLVAVEEAINKRLLRIVEEKKFKCKVALKAEKTYEALILIVKRASKRSMQGAKKKYFGKLRYVDGQRVPDDKYDNKNMAGKRSDTSRFMHEVQDTALKMVLGGKSTSEVNAYLSAMREEIKKRPIVEVGIPRGLKSTEQNNPWARGAKWTAENLDPLVMQHLKPKLLYVHEAKISMTKVGDKQLPGTDSVCFDDPEKIPSEVIECIDWKLMIEKSIDNKMDGIMKVLDMANQTSLEQFMEA